MALDTGFEVIVKGLPLFRGIGAKLIQKKKKMFWVGKAPLEGEIYAARALALIRTSSAYMIAVQGERGFTIEANLLVTDKNLAIHAANVKGERL